MRQAKPLPLDHHERVRRQKHDERHRAERDSGEPDEHEPRQLELDGQAVECEQAQQQEVQGIAELARLLAVVLDEQEPEHQRGEVYEQQREQHGGTFVGCGGTARVLDSIAFVAPPSPNCSFRAWLPVRDQRKANGEQVKSK